jgi:hypothetical protein
MPKYRTMQGKEIDMDKLMAQNELMPAIGNMKVNARGDELGPGGKIIRKREEVMAEYYENNPKSRANRTVEKTVNTKTEEKSQTQKNKKQVNNNED